MNILNVAYPLLPVGPDASGGAEQILSLIERGLLARGHRSVVIAAAGSEIAGELIESAVVRGEITEEVRQNAQQVHRECIQRALKTYSIDLIHFHGLDFYSYLPEEDVPVLATLHLPISFYPPEIFADRRVCLNCVSEMQANSVPCRNKPPVVCNGIDTERFRRVSSKKEFLLMLTRICPEKGVHIALEIAHRLDVALIIAGPVHPFKDHEIYFSEQVRPKLDERRHYVGAAGSETKTRLLAEAQCLLIPSSVEETSSLVAMEAMSSGTPVIGLRSGALPEIIDHGETGFVVDSEAEMAEAVGRISEISPAKCRRTAQRRFDARRMVDEYIGLYRSVMEKVCSSSRGSV
ncbi:MAG: glycosyltransferase family 4 protein [Acidobacteriaceae bacterium]|nr:glycosyltransferase family 4 protein [Acidobacteriaceae bacterium]MBV9780759.1 glycosyltransferase family 4 protein [Acidobacteriaceae bacterium]